MKKFNNVISSPFRWAGSKKKLLDEMLNFFDDSKEIYLEPFLGSGIVLINLLENRSKFKFKKFIVNDTNKNIIGFYQFLKENPEKLNKDIKKVINQYNCFTNMYERERFYYDVREQFNHMKFCDKKIVNFWFLMKAGFNGVYRENSKGIFNVPFGKKERIILAEEDLLKISRLIENVEFNCLDYGEFFTKYSTQLNKSKSFIYLDPPYLPEDTAINRTHIMYTKNRFNHKELHDKLLNVKENSFMLSMSGSKLTTNMYGNFEMKCLSEVIRTINPKKSFKSKEVIFVNYHIDNLTNTP
ncbi:MAG: DNA adenine methylase [Bacilli bacterium]|nr:DNA adenine methylase [Bacilli bacterium]